jgi:hypothetical protein
MHQGRLHGKLHVDDAVHGALQQHSLPRPTTKLTAAIRQHHAVAKSAATGMPASSSLASPLTFQQGSNYVSNSSSKLLLPPAAGRCSIDLACSDDVTQQAWHACAAAELALLQELVQDAQQLQELLDRHPEVLQAQHPSPLQAWVRCADLARHTEATVVVDLHVHCVY